MSQPSNLFSLSYQGVRAQRPPNVIVKNFNPSSTASQNVDLGDFWINFNPQTPTQAKLWVLLSLAGGVATWVEIASALGDLLTLTGDTGGAINPIAGNINIKGDGTTIGTTGNNGTATITISATGVFTNFVSIVDAVASATAPADLNLIKTRAGGPINSGDQLGCVNFAGTDSGSTQIIAASICSTNSGTIAANRVAGDLEFSTHPDSASGVTPTRRMTITSAGNMVLNQADNDTLAPAGTTVTLAVTGTSIISRSNDNTGVTNGAGAGLLRTRASGPILTGDTIGEITFEGFDSNSAPAVAAQIISAAEGTIAAAQVPGNLQFLTASSVGVTHIRQQIDRNGIVTISTPDTTNAALQVHGSVSVQGDPGSGVASSTDFTNATAAAGGGAGAIALQAGGVGVTQQGWLKIYVNGAVRYLPFYG